MDRPNALKRGASVVAGLIFFGMGTVGIFLPILPTVPLYMLAGICLARGSARLNAWFESTGFYKEHALPIREGRGMTLRSKITSFVAITLFLGFGFYMMRNTPAKWILIAVIVFHAWLFFLHLPTREDA
ncbi:MAG TPA: YbaN family protein [Atopobiaceae bacterium]|nr:YbaN family protein [Atopobiaceae bacterium]